MRRRRHSCCSFSEAVSAELRGTGVTMTALCPGPVATEFVEAGGFKTENPGPSFVCSSAEDVARAGIEGADKGKRVVIPGLGNRFQATLGQHSPRALDAGSRGQHVPPRDRRVTGRQGPHGRSAGISAAVGATVAPSGRGTPRR